LELVWSLKEASVLLPTCEAFFFPRLLPVLVFELVLAQLESRSDEMF
jgi:hypothetical protein